MKKLFINGFLICTIAAFLFFMVTDFLLPRTIYKGYYIGATVEKQEKLRSVPSPRLIFTGGSNIAFSLDTKMISDSIGLPVVNMGLHAGLGLDYILKETLSGIRSGDIVILMPEYLLQNGQVKLLALLSSINPDSHEFIELSHFDKSRLKVFQFQIFFRYSFYKFSKTNERDTIYTRYGFSPEGDLITHLKYENDKPFTKNIIIDSTYDYSSELISINTFIKSVEQKKAKVIYCFPNCSKRYFLSNQKVLNAFTDEIRQKINCTVIGEPEMFLYDDVDIYDAIYHLKKNARHDRSVKVVQLLKTVLK